MNSWIGLKNNDLSLDTTDFYLYQKESDLVHPGGAGIWLFLDENPWSINDGLLLEKPSSANQNPPAGTSWYDCPATYHNNACGIAFCDGHAQIRKWTDPTVLTWELTSTGNPVAPKLPGDVNWLDGQTTWHK
jgi:prepilin-type processing-associated H-X9-DG protein